jgi:hypothetical protein
MSDFAYEDSKNFFPFENMQVEDDFVDQSSKIYLSQLLGTLSLLWPTFVILERKIASLMQCADSVTDLSFPGISYFLN